MTLYSAKHVHTEFDKHVPQLYPDNIQKYVNYQFNTDLVSHDVFRILAKNGLYVINIY